MKKYSILTVAAIAAFCGCTNDTVFEEGAKENGVKTFTATIQNESDTRVTLNDKTPNWEVGDIINIDGHEYAANDLGTTVSFTGTGAIESPHHAYFPACLYNNGVPTLPATQTYIKGKFNMPMYAESSTTDLLFKNICAVLAVKITNVDIATLKSIKVTSDKALCGAFSISDGKAILNANATNKSVEMVSESALTLDTEGITFYISIPSQIYNFLNIYLSSDGINYNVAMATRKSEGLGELVRNKIFSIDYESNAFQLWENGPKFAKFNVGVNDGKPESFGGLYLWGGSSNKGTYYNKGNYNLSGTSDTATCLWGNNWRMPTKEEFKALLEKCTIEDVTLNRVAGKMFTGKDDYSNISVFLPGAGFDNLNPQLLNKGYGYYWSSTPDPAYATIPDSFDLYFCPVEIYVADNQRNSAFSVRAVLNE